MSIYIFNLNKSVNFFKPTYKIIRYYKRYMTMDRIIKNNILLLYNSDYLLTNYVDYINMICLNINYFII